MNDWTVTLPVFYTVGNFLNIFLNVTKIFFLNHLIGTLYGQRYRLTPPGPRKEVE